MNNNHTSQHMDENKVYHQERSYSLHEKIIGGHRSFVGMIRVGIVYKTTRLIFSWFGRLGRKFAVLKKDINDAHKNTI